MPIAEIHGKISRSGSNLSEMMEDLLTSYVFGALRYIDDDLGINPILSEAVNLNDLYLEIAECGNWEYDFWPRYTRSEPDVFLRNKTMNIFIEAKLHSGKSGVFSNESRTEELSESYVYKDQLAREWMDLVEIDKGRKSILIYLTNNLVLPESDIQESCNELVEQKDKFKSSTYWLSWNQIYFTLCKLRKNVELTEQQKRVITDIIQVLDHRNLKSFLRITRPEVNIYFPDSVYLFYLPNLITGYYPNVQTTEKIMSWNHQKT